ncbi:MAG: methylated-DNA--[protein]-cysteine S-methyltransferase [Actinomycetota bacterium]
MPPTHVRYEVDGWGVGEMWIEGDRLLHHELPRLGLTANGETHPLADRLAGYFASGVGDFGDVELDLEGASAFERDLTAALRRVPPGETVTYGELAALAGRPSAQRAAGTFCARNRFGIVVPCHRVIAASGLGSYGSLGVGYKRRLLELEGVAV